jgi:hypothetical protein
VNAPIIALISVPLILARICAVAIALGLWFWTQALLARRQPTAAQGDPTICDGVHRLTASINARLLASAGRATALLIASSAVIDVLGFYLLGSALFGPTIEPFLGLFILFALRQFCQFFCPLPPPPGMIWRKTGVPTLLVTYGTSNDLFFSGHTAIAVYAAATLAAALGPLGLAFGLSIALFEISTVLVLRAHYTMDVFAGAITALYVHRLAIDWAPTIDQWLAHIATIVAR